MKAAAQTAQLQPPAQCFRDVDHPTPGTTAPCPQRQGLALTTSPSGSTTYLMVAAAGSGMEVVTKVSKFF